MKILALIAYSQTVPLLLAQAPCVPVSGPDILGGDLARAVPVLGGLPADVPLAPAPLPGGTRVFYSSELQSLAARFSRGGVAPNALPKEVCFNLAAEKLSNDRVVEAMRKALGISDARIELLEASPLMVPVGQLEFAREGLGAPAAPDRLTPVSWRGNIVYAGNRRFPVQAKVRITAPSVRVVAVEPLRSGVAIKPEQVRQENIEGFPQATGESPSLDRIAGMMAVHPVAAGAEIRLDNLTRPNDVNRGELVHVEVRFGGAHLVMEGRAETAGHIGDVVSVRNPESSKTFRALVEAKDRVVVEPGVDEGN